MRIFSVVLLLFGASACTPDAQPKEQLDVVRVARSTLLTNAPLAIGDEEGDFKREGIKLEFVEVPAATTQAMPPLERGDVDVLSSVMSIALLNGVGAGATFRIVADRGFIDPAACESWGIIGRKSLFGNKPLDAELLRGTRVSTNALGQSGYLMSRFLEKFGLALDDVELVRLPPNVEPPAMENGTVDIVTRGDPHMHNLLAQGHRLLAGASTIAPGSHLAVLLYGPNLLTKNRDLGERFMRGYLRAARRYNQGATPRNVSIVSRRLGLDSASLWNMCWPTTKPDGAVSAASLHDYQEWALKTGELASAIDPALLIDATFAAKANAALAAER
ncbi:MAG TPA: ABC transporter substrate-binding protein [Gemmatimonadaceae bacterium]|nr:ABC transporter substrate-binding protein [Gemmatimonadaceae bacterium]